MSLEGKATQGSVLRGKINSLDVLVIDAYGVAVRNGFKGTEAEWLASLKGADGKDGKDGEKGEKGDNAAPCVITHIDLPSANWQGTASPYTQVVSIDGVTKNSRVTLDLSAEQLEAFRAKDIAFTTKNVGGVITVSCVGQKPVNDYTLQVLIMEVIYNG